VAPDRAAAGAGPIWVWRHPRARGAAGRCIGRSDLAVDPRKARRLARAILKAARRHDLPREIWTSPLRRARDVGRWLRRWGWTHRVDARLVELDFGAWDGRFWNGGIAWAEVEAWQQELLCVRPGGNGESLIELASRVRAFAGDRGLRTTLVVGHAGWINAALHVPPGLARLDARDWPLPPRHGSVTRVNPCRSLSIPGDSDAG
jgi:alpha-ribazole phosphatase